MSKNVEIWHKKSNFCTLYINLFFYLCASKKIAYAVHTHLDSKTTTLFQVDYKFKTKNNLYNNC